MRRMFVVSLSCILVFLLFLLINQREHIESPGEKEEGHALEAFENWYNQRAAPYDKIPNGAFLRAAMYARTSMPNERDLSGPLRDTSQWSSIGPDNVGGRVLAIAIDPVDPNEVWVGGASGGLWKSTTAGLGTNAWTYVNTGFPTVAVSSIAINPINTSIMYIGTGEVGSAYGRGQVGTPGARSSYGMGVLKTTDGGNTWAITGLVFTFPQVTAVQKVLLNPLNPNTIFAITTEGTYRSRNGGNTWTLVHGILMGMDIVINPQDTTILYAAYGQRNSTSGIGMYKSTSAGSSWTLLTALDTVNFGRTSLAISPTNPQIVYAGVARGSNSQLRGLYKTTNGGTSWSLMTTTNYMGSQGWYDNVIAVHPVHPETVLCAGLDIYKSQDGGNTLFHKSFWYLGYDNVVPPGGPEGPPSYAHADHHSITFHPADPNVIFFGTDGGVFVSTDGGETFEGRNGGFVTTQFYSGFANAETSPVIALGGLQDNGTLKYEGGASWNKTYGGDGGWCAIDPTNENILYEEYVYLAMSKSTDGGANWFGITSGLATGSSNANFIAPFVISQSTANILYAGAKTVYKTSNGGANWFPTNGGLDFNGTPVACIGVSARNSDTLIAGTGSSATGAIFQIFASTNGGTTWTNVTGTLPNRYPTDIAFDPNSSLVAYLTYSGYGTSHVFKTTNAGQSWADISSNLPDIPVQAVVPDPLLGHLYVGTDLGIYRSLNGGTSWEVFDNGMPPAMVLDLTISSANRSLRASTFGNGVYERELPAPDIFDYRTLAFVSPANGSELPTQVPISPISASFRNNGVQAPTDSFDVKYRILNGATVMYSDVQRTPGLATSEIRTITFAGAFTPVDTGAFTLEAISLTDDQNDANDTLRGILKVVVPGTIASANVLKAYCPYMEITGGTPGPEGDDVQTATSLPFPFQFDGFQYDSIQISTNGWAEFGTGERGSERGLSTEDQIGLGNANGSLFTVTRPTKTLGIWWEDLNTHTAGDPTAGVTYTALGTAPDRVFVIQWKNMLSYYDPVTTTTRINFQIRLHEGSHLIEYHYGPVLAGTLAGSDLGAMIGMKDHVGGNYHFYDFALGGTGTINQGITNLSPLTDWPGEDSCYIIGDALVSATVTLDAHWNLVSVPATRLDNSVPAVFPTAINGTVHEFSSGVYELRDSLAPGRGYWAKVPATTNQLVWGTALSSVSVQVSSGWNLIGSVDHTVPAPAGGIVSSRIYGHSNAAGYLPATALVPGRGYWVQVSSAGSIMIGPSPNQPPPAEEADKFNSITFRDNPGRRQTLFFTDNSVDPVNLELYEMPPLPPGGSFDARFASQRILEAYGSDAGFTYPIVLHAAEFPVHVTCSIIRSNGRQFFLDVIEGSTVIVSQTLANEKSFVIAGADPVSLVLRIMPDIPMPKEYALQQNYPNPFNPVTTIEYALPYESNVRLTVYDMLGREVAHLVDVTQSAGYHAVEWNGRNAAGASAASGVYFFRIDATRPGGSDFVNVRKMVLMK